MRCCLVRTNLHEEKTKNGEMHLSEDWLWDPLRSNVLMTCETYFTEYGMHGMNLGSHLLEIRECCSIVT